MLAVLMLMCAADPPRAGKLDPRPANRFTAGDEREQVVQVSRRSTVTVAGVPLVQYARYTLTSKLAVTEPTADGGAVVRQTVTAAELAEADDMQKVELTAALKKLVGQAFDLTVTASGEATKLAGLADDLRAKRMDEPKQLTIRVGTVLDADGWKELAGLTLFAPDAGGKPWDRPTAHDWGPLGGWAGRTAFARRGTPLGRELYEFRHALSYRPPQPGAGDKLPLRLIDPRFAVTAAGGVIGFDPKLGRVAAADELFKVRGTATAVVAGQAVRVELEEEQAFEVRVRPPGDGVLKAKRPGS